MEVRPHVADEGYQGRMPSQGAIRPAAAAFCDGPAAARRRTPVAKLPSEHVALAGWSTTVVLVGPLQGGAPGTRGLLCHDAACWRLGGANRACPHGRT